MSEPISSDDSPIVGLHEIKKCDSLVLHCTYLLIFCTKGNKHQIWWTCRYNTFWLGL